MKHSRLSLFSNSAALALLLVWALTFIGCGSDSSKTSQTTPAPSPGTPPPSGGSTGSTGGSTSGGTTTGGTTGSTTGATTSGSTTGGTTTGGTTTGGSTGGTGSTGSGTGGSGSGTGGGTTSGGTTGGGTGSSVQSYTVTDLAVLNSDINHMPEIPNTIDASGDVAGASQNGRGFLYTRGSVLTIFPLNGFTYTTANGINNSQQVVGSSWYMDGELQVHHAILYNTHDGARDINFFPGGISQALGINAAGQIVGFGRSNARSDINRAVLYTNGDIQDLGPGSANAINDGGTVVGALSTDSPGHQHAFVYSDGKMKDLGTLGGPNSRAMGINNDGVIVGTSDVDIQGHFHAFVFDSDGMRNLGSLAPSPSLSAAFGINSSGDIVGWTGTDNKGGFGAFIYHDGKMQDLNTMIPSDSGVHLSVANAINDAGQIAAYGTIGNQTHAFLLTPKQ